MLEALLLFAALLANLLGMVWLALAMDAHWRQVRAGTPWRPATAKRLRAAGVAALAASLACCLRVDHASMAVLVWIMTLAAAALAVAFALAWRARWLGKLLP